jgi:ankyrin repeat protein
MEVFRYWSGNSGSFSVFKSTFLHLIHRAAYNGHSSIVKLLLEAGSDVEVFDESGQAPIDVSPLEIRTIIEEELQKRGDNGRSVKGNKQNFRMFAPANFQLSLIAKGEITEHQRSSGLSRLELLEDLWNNEEINLEHRDFEKG